MAKPLKSQWEFGELFPAEEIRKVLTVTEITGSVRRVLEKEIGQPWVTGEITNLRVQASGHVYFAIKDANAQLSCVLFRNEARTVNREFLTDGQKVVLQGELTVYEPRGQYQLRVVSVQLQGVGALQVAFERLKQKLQGEGLFDAAHKRPLPRYPQAVGLVTSLSGAAIRDVLHTVQRRNPALRLVLAPCRVQGAGAGQEIAGAIQMLNEWAGAEGQALDLILVTRGGGSLEDLWAFNEEIVARAIYGSRLPVISAVGHEIDFTISDFTADFRAATPTAAAEIMTEGVFASRQFIAAAQAALRESLGQSLAEKREELERALRGLARLHPRRRLSEHAQRLDELQSTVLRCTRKQLRQCEAAFQNICQRFLRTRPETVVHRRREVFLGAAARLHEAAALQMRQRQERLGTASTKLRLLSPQNVLDRGYSITMDAATGAVVREAGEIPAGREIISKLKEGEIRSVVQPGKPA